MIAGQSAHERALSDRSTIVRRAAQARLEKMPLGPEEGFVVSRVDRPMSVTELLLVCGFPETSALPVLLNLLMKGALVLPGEDTGEAAVPVPAQTRSPYDDFSFNSRELNEDVDLDLERRKQILFLFHRRDSISYYRLLGVSPNASEADIRKAYLEKSRVYHPDTYFRKRLGSYQDKLDVLFQKVKEAHDALMEPVARRKYEWEARRLFTSDEIALLVQREIDSIEDERRRKVRRGALFRSKGFAKLTRARDELAEGDALLAKGTIASAIQKYQAAMDLDPRLEEARTRLAEARKLALLQRTDQLLAEADRVEKEGSSERAIELVKSALEIDGTNARVYAALAGLLLRWGGEPKEARSHVQKAITLGDKSGATRLLHGEILIKLGLKKAARIEVEAAVELGEGTRAEALLKEC